MVFLRSAFVFSQSFLAVRKSGWKKDYCSSPFKQGPKPLRRRTRSRTPSSRETRSPRFSQLQTIDLTCRPHTASVVVCLFACFSLFQTIYSRLFEWVVAHVNAAIDPALLSGRGNDVVATVGILDIYGFGNSLSTYQQSSVVAETLLRTEIFETNSFEQFCINYANEKLQRVFITRTLEAEQAEYDAEDIQWNHIDYFNNKIVCDLIEKKPVRSQDSVASSRSGTLADKHLCLHSMASLPSLMKHAWCRQARVKASSRAYRGSSRMLTTALALHTARTSPSHTTPAT